MKVDSIRIGQLNHRAADESQGRVITCRSCGEEKPVGDFFPSMVKRHKYSCKPCWTLKAKEWRAANRDKARGYSRKYNAANRAKVAATSRAWELQNKEWVTLRKAMTGQSRANHLKSRYGVTDAGYALMVDAQNGKCGCCGSPPSIDSYNGERLAVDHCHDTGRIRGLLCHRCNSGIGMLGDSAAGVFGALEYLRGERSLLPSGTTEGLLF